MSKNGETQTSLIAEIEQLRNELTALKLTAQRQKSAEDFNDQHNKILEMIAIGCPAAEIYDAIALMYESRHPKMRCSMLELDGDKLMHGGAPSLPKEYCDAVNGLKNGPSVGSCGTSTYTGKRVVVEDIETDPKWAAIKHLALPHGMRSCWSEPIKSSSGKVLGAFGMYHNYPARPNEQESIDLISAARLTGIVMERDQSQKQIRALAYTDDLTGLANRASFYQRLEDLIKISQRYNRQFALLYIDLDDFKRVNDSLGHDAGDALLVAIAKRLESTCREVDFTARLSGDEFCILVEQLDSKHTTITIAQRCLEAISQPLELFARNHTPTSSIGIAHYPNDGVDLASLTKAADTSLYAAKENGKNQFALYKKELTERAEYRFKMEQCLREAIEKQQLHLVYQPQFDVKTKKVVGFEALSRWHHPELGQVPPVDFIATAERIGMIKPLTEWALNTACLQAATWQQAGQPTLQIAVNISPIHFRDKDFLALVKRTIDETKVNPSQLQLEVTEGIVQTDQENLSIFKALKSLGVQLAIDDFGSGYSSFASLKHLMVDVLKIDKYFIDDILLDEKSMLLVRSMIEMGKKLGYSVVVEGVEQSAQLNLLEELGCETVQGYLLSKPVSANETIKLFY